VKSFQIRVWRAALCLIFCAVAAPPLSATFAQDLLKTPLEEFATRQSAEMGWSKMIGQIESRESRATVTALTLKDRTRDPNQMRGVRIDLAHRIPPASCNLVYTAWSIMCKRPNAAVYIEEKRLATVRNSLKEGAAELRPFEFISAYETGPRFGLIVCGYQFEGVEAGELAALLTRAINELNGAR
jgi:hypothetical protein